MATLIFDKTNRLIIVDIADTEVTIQELLTKIRDFEDNPNGMDIGKIADASGKEELGGGVLVGITLKLIDWKLKFADRPPAIWITCNVSGGNLVAVDDVGNFVNPIEPSSYVTVTKTSSSSATLLDQESLRTSIYGGVVYVDIDSGSAGTTFPIGTLDTPVDNQVDAKAIADEYNINTLVLLSDCNTLPGGSFTNFNIRGSNPVAPVQTLTVNSASILENFSMKNLYIQGDFSSSYEPSIEYCSVRDISNFMGHIHQCELYGTMSLKGNTTADFINCFSGRLNTPPIVNLSGSNINIGVRSYTGGIMFISSSTDTYIVVDLVSGYVVMDSSCVSGTVNLRGVGYVIDNSEIGCIVNADYLVNTPMVWQHISGSAVVRNTKLIPALM